MCLNKKDLKGSPAQNYLDLKVLSVKFLYKQSAIFYVSNKVNDK